MRKISIFLIYVLLLSCIRLKGGPSGFNSFFSQTINLPDTYSGVGNLITRISIDPAGEIHKIDIINPVDTVMESEMIRVIKLSQKYWRKCDTISHNQVFYVQTVFSIAGIVPNYYRPVAGQYRSIFPSPVFIQRKSISQKLPVADNIILERLNNCIDSTNYEAALPLINELLKRDPFNRDLYKVRIMINFNLDRKDEVMSDDNRLMNFAEGYSLDDLLRDNESRDL